MNKGTTNIKKDLLFELIRSHSIYSQQEYDANPSYNDTFRSHKTEVLLIDFMREQNILKEFLEYNAETTTVKP